MKLELNPTSIIVAIFAVLGVIGSALLAFYSSLYSDQQSSKTQVVLELMRSNNKEDTLEKLIILRDSGLLKDDDGRLLKAIKQAPSTVFVNIPVPIACIRPDQIPAPLPEAEPLPKDMQQALATAVGRVGDLKYENDILRALARLIHRTGFIGVANVA